LGSLARSGVAKGREGLARVVEDLLEAFESLDYNPEHFTMAAIT
jgi:hypothetical protein